MIRTTTPKATWEQMKALAQDMANNGHTPQECMRILKDCKYIVNGIHYNASVVASFVEGVRWVESVLLPKLNNTTTLTNIEAQFEIGALKYTKGKGLHNPKKVA